MTTPLLTFVHISDTHIPADADYKTTYATLAPHPAAVELVKQINTLPIDPAFVLHTGDVAYDPYPKAYAACREILGEIKYPVHYVAGNHDASAALQNALVQRGAIDLQLHYEFEVNGVQIVIADSNGPTEPPAGYMTDHQLAWLREKCSADDPRPLVIATHHNPVPVSIPWLDHYMGIQNGDAFHDAILPARDRIRGVFFGHVHQNLAIHRNGILYASTVSPWTQFHAWPGQTDTIHDPTLQPGFNVVTIYDNQTLIRRHHYSFTADER